MPNSAEVAAFVEAEAQAHGVPGAIHDEDHIFNFIMDHGGFPDDASRVRYYFADGQNSSEQLLDLIRQHLPDTARPRLLEFASGYGCVSRHLVNRSDEVELICCDIHDAAIAFLTTEIGANARLSRTIPEKLDAGSDYDVVFALSFFSHMPVTTWARWLVQLLAAVRPGGILAFTTQGRDSMPHLNCLEVPDPGFWFKAESEQHDLPVDEYGQTVIMPELVRQTIGTIADAELLEAREGYWWGHQDLFIVRRTA